MRDGEYAHIICQALCCGSVKVSESQESSGIHIIIEKLCSFLRVQKAKGVVSKTDLNTLCSLPSYLAFGLQLPFVAFSLGDSGIV
jgi:hypothetical protein